MSGGAPEPAELAEAAGRRPLQPAPARGEERRLDVVSDGVAFPDWEPRMGWRATGVREDTLDGQRAVTVTYERGGREVAYAILERPALDLPENGGGAYKTLEFDGRPAVAWIRDGRTCLLLGDDDTSPATLRRLAQSVRYS